MLLSKDAIADVVEVVRGTDFYRPAHETIYEAILDLYGRGEPADPVTVAAELQKGGEIGRVGGAPYLHTLVSSVPTAANAGFYAEIVRERAILRRLVEAGTRIVQMGYGGDGETDDIVDRAQAEVYAVTERRTAEDYMPLSDIMEGALDEIEAIGSRGGEMIGVPTGFTDLDNLTNGLHPGQMIIIAARPAIGKALALDTPLPTPTGWTTMGDVQVGDLLIGADGKPTRVVAATEVMHGRTCYEVEFSDGTVIVADAEHQWETTTRARRRNPAPSTRTRLWSAESVERAALIHAGSSGTAVISASGAQRGTYVRSVPAYSRKEVLTEVVKRVERAVASSADRSSDGIVTTEQIAKTLRCPTADRRLNHSVKLAKAIELPARDLPLPPYTLGVWLGDGHSRDERPRHCRQCHAHHGTVPAILRSLGVWGNKHIPREYLRASIEQRRALLAGLLDTDGYVNTDGVVQFAVTSRMLAEGVLELVHSLGYRARMTTKQVNGRTPETSTSYCVTFTPGEPVFRLQRKLARQRPGQGPRSRMIVDVRPMESVPVRCVQVDSSDHLYLAGRSFIPTHNSTVGLDIARAASIKNQMASVIFSLEMGRNEITTRLLSAEARVPLHHMRTGQMTDDDWNRIARSTGEVSSAPLFIDDSPNMTMMEIRAKCRRLKQRNDLKLVIVDYLQLMSSGKKVESRQQEVSEFSRAFKLLAKELEVPVITIAQLNRGPEQRNDKKPMLSDLRESGCLTADTALMRADTGSPVTFAELMSNGYEGVLVWSLDESRRLVPAPLTNVFPSGIKETFRLQLRSGRQVKASGNHQFLTLAGWRQLDELSPGDRLAIPRQLPEPLAAGLGWPEERIGLLAHLIGDGCVLRKQPVHYTSEDEENLTYVEHAARAEFGISPRRVRQGNWQHVYLPSPQASGRGRRNPLHVWFGELGIENLRSHEKRLPDALYRASDAEIALFLRHLWATDGRVAEPSSVASGVPIVSYSSTSRALVDGVAVLLARLGIIARISSVQKGDHRPDYRLVVRAGPDLRTFCHRVGVHGARGKRAERLFAELDGRATNTNVDTLPREVWELVKAERIRAGLTDRQFQADLGTRYSGTSLYKSSPSRDRLLRIADVLDSDVLRMAAGDDVFWDEIVQIEPLGPEPVYDATVKGTHNFIADGIVAHNSLEQDADMVILLHREDAYEKESPRAGEADFIVAKHRNGPTATITVAFQGHYSRFVDMAQ
jgi:replicative DNA helicase